MAEKYLNGAQAGAAQGMRLDVLLDTGGARRADGKARSVLSTKLSLREDL